MHRFGVDAAIVYSDILIIPSAMGLTVEMVPTRKQAEPKPGEPAKVESSGPMRPNFPNPLVEPTDLDRVNFSPDIEGELGFVCNTIRRCAPPGAPREERPCPPRPPPLASDHPWHPCTVGPGSC